MRFRSVPADRLYLGLMLALTSSTGIIDAVGYLGLDKVFTGNMTGNVVILGMGFAGAEGLPVFRPMLALVCFLGGAVVGGRAVRSLGNRWGWQTSVCLGVTATACAALAAVLLLVDHHAHGAVGSIATSALGFAMGMQAAVARRLKVADVTTVVVTSTITGLGADSLLAGGNGELWARRALAVGLIMLGALVGAALLQVHIAAGLFLSAVITGVVATAGELHRRSGLRAQRRSPVEADAASHRRNPAEARD